MGRKGSGFKKILGEYKFQPKYTEELKPVFHSDYDSFLLILYNQNYNPHKDTTLKTNPKTYPKTNLKTNPKATTVQILELMKDNPSVSRKELARILGITKEGIKYHIRNLRADGFITYVGSSKKGYWKILKQDANE